MTYGPSEPAERATQVVTLPVKKLSVQEVYNGTYSNSVSKVADLQVKRVQILWSWCLCVCVCVQLRVYTSSWQVTRNSMERSFLFY